MEECVSSDQKKMMRLKEEFSWARSELRKAQDAFRKTSAKLTSTLINNYFVMVMFGTCTQNRGKLQDWRRVGQNKAY